MKDSLRGALFSALIFPGSGQMLLKEKKRGLFFASISVAGIIAMVISVVTATWAGMEQVALQGIEIKISVMVEAAINSFKAAKTYILPLLIICWLSSIVDAWMLGKRRVES